MQGATNMQSTNEQPGMLRDAAVAGAAGTAAGAGAGSMAGRNQVRDSTPVTVCENCFLAPASICVVTCDQHCPWHE